jgi:hypothetical protein
VHKRREARGLTSVGKQVRLLLLVFTVIFLMFVVEQGIGQGPSLQPHSCSVDLEEAQHTLSSPLPVICLRFSCYFPLYYFMLAMLCMTMKRQNDIMLLPRDVPHRFT